LIRQNEAIASVEEPADGLAQVRAAFQRDTEGSLRDRVYRSLRSVILARGFRGSDRITEVELSNSLKVSRTPLREAFRLLQAEGLVNMADGRGIVVRGMGVQDFLEIYEIRAALDGVVARNATKNRTPEFLKKLEQNIEMAEFLLTRQRWQELQAEFRRFHRLIQDACGNTRLRDLLSNLQDYSSASSEFTCPTPEHAPATHADHVRLYEAIKSGDAEAAAKAAIMHVDNERQELLTARAKL
jgi:DNA-binding GntR family transcriptional regulator